MDCISRDKIKKLEELIGEYRFNHSLGVMETAERFCKALGENPDKGKIAGLFHDCGKFLDKKMAFEFIKDNNLVYPEEYLENFQLLHPHLGADVARIVFDINDDYILDSIRYHTTLRENPSLLDKIIFITDAIEPGRDFEGVEKLRDLANKNIDEAILFSLDDTIKALINKGKYLGIDTIKARNYFLNIVEKWNWFFDLLA